jgi:D-alanyl-lipoteichoic acid acyltransferase DltB (MBOAT superfamily)
MLFNSPVFLAFLAAFFVPYFALRGRARTGFILLASYLFYGWWDWRFLGLIALTTTVDYFSALAMAACADAAKRKRFLLASACSNLVILGFFKYFNFFVSSANDAAALFGWHLSPWTLRVVLPVGISFYTFQSLSYVADVYRDRLAAERDWLRYAAYLAFFPQLVAGPIERASHLLPQFGLEHAFDGKRALSGLQLAVWGFAKKVVVADSLAPLVEARFGAPLVHGALDLWLGLYFYAFQIYCDFSGYSDIARGVARMLGFDLMVNFDRPYFSRSLREFWTRWHVSLSGWLRDYLYIPLGGGRGKAWSRLRALMLTMLLGGLWHGAAWTFVFWGFFHGTGLLAERAAGWKAESRSPAAQWLARAVIFHFVCLGWLFFRAPGFDAAMDYWQGLWRWADAGALDLNMAVLCAKAAALCVALFAAEAASFRLDFAAFLERHPALQFLALLAGVWCMLLLGNFSGHRFIYFRF